MIAFRHFALRRGSRLLLSDIDLVIQSGWRLGVIGRNGCGKSSLFAALQGQVEPDAGDLDLPAKLRLAAVAQETPMLPDPAIEYVLGGDEELAAALRDEADAQARGDIEAMARAHHRIEELHGYDARARAGRLLHGLGFAPETHEVAVKEFSGGWRVRLNLARALMAPSELLLLDEPTNHLDLDAIIWLEDWLKRYPGTLIVISHDRDFLDGVVNVILQIDERKLKRYSGNYSAFERQRAAQLALSQAAFEKQARQRAHLQSFIDRFKAKATKARQAQSRMKMLAKMEELAPLRAASEFSFEFREPLSAPNPLLAMEDVDAGYPGTNAGAAPVTIVGDITFSLQNGQRIGLLGVNGAGKSTLVKTIAAELAPLSGDLRFGKGLVIGYFAQHQVEMLRHEESPLWHLARIAPNVREQELRNFLGGFNFGGDMVTSPIAPFSGGEKARLALALIVWQRPNLLLLDEPTNHLDLETREALTMALAQFEGTLLLVSHDRHLLRATTDQFMIVADGRLQPFDGDLDDYRDWLFKTKLGKSEAPETAATKQAGDTGTREDRQERRRMEAEERQRMSALRKPIESRLKRLDEQIATLSARKGEVDATLADPAIYDDARKDELKALILDQASLSKELEQLETEWLEQQEALEQVGG